MDSIYTWSFSIPDDVIDENGHVNNVHFIQWMQDVAVRHYEAMGGIEVTRSLGATWVVRSHHVEYFLPVFAGEEIEVRTWVVNIRRVRSLRRYEFLRKQGGNILVKGETDWVFVDVKNGMPLAIPLQVQSLFSLVPDEK